MNSDDKKDLKLVLVSVLFLIWFCGSVALMIYGAKNDEVWLVPTLLGTVFIVFGAIATYATVSEKSDRWWMGPVAIVVGLVVTGYGLVMNFGSKSTVEAAIDGIPTVVSIGACVIVAFIAAVLSSQYRKLKASCDREVIATCVEHRKQYSKGHALICPVYEVVSGEEKVQYCKSEYSRMKIPQIGEQRTIYVDGEHTDRYIEPIVDKCNNLFQIFIGASIFVCVVIFAIVSIVL